MRHKEFITDCSEANVEKVEEKSSDGRHADTKAGHVVVERQEDIGQMIEVLCVGAKQYACHDFFNFPFRAFA